MPRIAIALCAAVLATWTSSSRALDAPGTSAGGQEPTPTVTVAVPASCVGDCDLSGAVLINELILGVNILLGSAAPSMCLAYPGSIDISRLVSAVNNLLNGCPPTPTPTVPVGGALGVRRVSLDPHSSHIRTLLSPGIPAFTFYGFEGFLELTAGEIDPGLGAAFVDVTDASEYLSINIPSITTAFCIKVPRDQLPVRQAGFVSCRGGLPAGFELVLDHNIGVIGECSDGANDGLACANDDACPDGTCFNAERCAAAGGTVEGPTAPFPGVCNGTFEASLLPADSGMGAVLIAPDPMNGLTNGLPAEIVVERATPCGDEPSAVGLSVVLALTSDRTRCEVHDHNNVAGATLEDDKSGENFSCGEWTREDGPGLLQFCAPVLNQVIVGVANPIDVITTFVFDDHQD